MPMQGLSFLVSAAGAIIDSTGSGSRIFSIVWYGAFWLTSFWARAEGGKRGKAPEERREVPEKKVRVLNLEFKKMVNRS